VLLAHGLEADVKLVVDRADVRAREAAHEYEVVRDLDVIGDVVDANVLSLLEVGEVCG
jgi:hypothetical protein